ncbi:MAG: YgiT-type zinc finger protein [Acidimicrobiia bacterium]|nr:YgiT-type zinc finger protein [Acidimicrobiia bacterium]NNF89445.1 YgiT-type zinc finger protein [Acidimicrobiia bacterium]NNL97882.1 YgiT-type zinc finger protein [Acidimicrobiia bacterium]
MRRTKTAERDGKVAVVFEVPMEECPSCGDRWMSWETSRRLDEILRSILDSDAELATRRFDSTDSAA